MQHSLQIEKKNCFSKEGEVLELQEVTKDHMSTYDKNSEIIMAPPNRGKESQGFFGTAERKMLRL